MEPSLQRLHFLRKLNVESYYKVLCLKKRRGIRGDIIPSLFKETQAQGSKNYLTTDRKYMCLKKGGASGGISTPPYSKEGQVHGNKDYLTTD